MDLYAPLVLRWLWRAGVTEGAVEELMHDVFSGLVKTMRTFRYDKTRKFRSWLYTVVMNKVKRRGTTDVASPLLDDQIANPDVRDPGDELGDKEFVDYLLQRAAIEIRPHFSEEAWTAFLQFHFEGKSTAEIAAAQGKKPGAVTAAIFRVVRCFRKEYGDLLD